MNIKWKNTGNWFTIYLKELSEKLDRTKNLSDLQDRKVAIENLGLTGNDNATHFHDDRYNPIIEDLRAKLNKEIQDRKNGSNAIRNEINNFKKYANGELDRIQSLIDQVKWPSGVTRPDDPTPPPPPPKPKDEHRVIFGGAKCGHLQNLTGSGIDLNSELLIRLSGIKNWSYGLTGLEWRIGPDAISDDTGCRENSWFSLAHKK